MKKETNTLEQNVMISSGKFEKEKRYWLNKLTRRLPIGTNSTFLFEDRSNINEPWCENPGQRKTFYFPVELYKEILRIGNHSEYGVFIILAAGLSYLVSKYSGKDDIILGTPILAQDQSVSYFNEMLPLRNNVMGEMTFKDFLLQVKETVSEAFENMNYPLEKILKQLDFPGDIHQLYDTVIMFKNIHGEGDDIIKEQKWDMVFSFNMADEYLGCELYYFSSLNHDIQILDRLWQHLINVYLVSTGEPMIGLSDIDLLSDEEKFKILYDFNNTDAEFPKPGAIHRLFEEQVNRTPDNIALAHEESYLTYIELNRRSNRLAGLLRQEGIRAGSIGGIMMERSIDQMTAVLSVLKADAAFIALDPKYPKNRLEFIIKDTNLQVILTPAKALDISPGFDGLTVNLDPGWLAAPGEHDGNRETEADIGERPAYIIYTSGSTGKPKGVLNLHNGVVNRCNWMWKVFPFKPNDRCCQKTSMNFVDSIWEMFGPLLDGVLSVIVPDETVMDVPKFLQVLKIHRVTRIVVVPSLLYRFFDASSQYYKQLSDLTFWVSSGEVLRPDFPVLFRESLPGSVLLNIYGPSETSADNTYYDTTANRESLSRVPIGRPIDNNRIYILDNHMHPVPFGVIAEIYVGGAGLAAGYLNRPELTAEKFGHDLWDLQDYHDEEKNVTIKKYNKKFLRGVQGGGFFKKSPPGRRRQRIYSTGDLGRYLPDGNIEYIARKDQQVKIRGFRIEPGEVERFLLDFNGIKEALVADKTDKNKEKYLCAYVVMDQEQTLELREMRRQLAHKLPDYMVPSFIVPLDKIPLTATGKVQRQALPEPHEAGVIPVGAYIPPRNDIERKLLEIWSGLLEVDKNIISIDSNFFEIGGHSLRAVTLISIIFKEFNVELQLGDFFLAPSIRQLGQLMGKTKKTVYTNIEPLEKRDYYELSSAQKRMYVIQQIDKNSKAYNMTNTIRFVGTIDIDKFEEVFQLVIQRHESLRTYFQMKEGEPVQRVHDKRDIRLKYLDAGEEDINTAIESFEQSFDLSEAPLFRAGLIKLGKEEHIFVVNINHIISDGITVIILMRELGMLYNGDSLPYLNIQYKDFASWQNTLVQSGEMSKQERYWLEKYRNGVTILDLPTDYARTAIQSFTGSLIHFDLDEQQTEAIKHFALRKNATLFMVLLAVFNILMAKLSGQEEIVLGTPVAGRNRHKDLEQLIGLFLNTLLLENSPRNEKTFDQFFIEVKENTIEAFENQDYQFENLVDKVIVDRNASRNPLFDVMFVLRNMEQPYVEIPGLKIEPYEYDNGSTKLDILLNGIEFRGKLCFYIRYCTKIYKRTTIERLIVYFRQVLDFVLEYPGKKISEIEMIPEEERKRILFDFNDTNREYPGNITLQELFQGRAAQVPDRSAVVYNQRQLTYSQLNERVNRLAHYLRDEYHVKSNHVIGVSVYRSLEMIIAVWGIIKSGAGYVAIDPNYPRERVDHILKDSRVQWVITDKKQSSRRLLEGYSGKQIDIQGDWKKIELKSPENPPIINQPDDLLYVIYTSGSTGTPNGAKLSHDLLTNLIRWQENHTCIDSSLRVLQFTTINFCVSFQEIMCTLTAVGQVYLIGDMERQEIDYLMNFLIKHSIEVLYLPFSYLNFLFNESNRWHEGFHHTLKHIITAGEQLKISRSMKIFLENNPGLRLHNHYGSSEMHVVTSFTLDHTLAAAHPIPPAGKPIANTKIYILDDNLKPVPIGAWGELFVESRRELLGYVHNEALTREKMVHVPALSGKRLYRSGDIGRWLEDGNIQLGGRKDCQVKVRGFRVEPGEIESKILAIQEVKDCVVVVREDKDLLKSLYAYVVLDHIDIPAIKEKISSFLPQYMVPRLIRLDSLPLMPNGKVDRENLPEPGIDFQEEANRVAPRNQVEKQVALIWQEVLGIEQVGIHTSFFDLGGNSLRSIKVNNKLKEVFQKDIPLVKMFEYTTIGELAQYLDDSKEKIDLRQVQLNKMVNQAKTRLKKIVKHR